MTIHPATLKQEVSLSALLARLGYQPAKTSGAENYYRSMLRKDDHTPSFAVNDQLGAWYDHGSGKGGNLIDFGLAYWPQLGFKDVLAKIWEVAQLALPDIPTAQRPNARRRKAQKLPHYQVQQVCELGTTESISQYLKLRGVAEIAAGHLQEVHYFVRDEKQQVKHFFAAGHRNESGGWEVRNKYFKGCLGRKGLTHYVHDTRRVALFEGYFDFLSWKHEHPDDNSSILVLNTLSLLEAALRVALAYPEINVYFDHDKGGRIATRTLLKALPYATDRSSAYEGHHDYNDKRKQDAKAMRHAEHPPKRDIFANVQVPFCR